MPYGFGSSSASVKSSNIMKRSSRAPKESLMVDVFGGIDKSTARHRLAGKGSLLYEAQNIFPYIQGRLMRRKDYTTINFRSSGATFPSFPAEGAMVGDAVVKKMVEFNNTICIIYEDDGDTGKVLIDSFDTGANTLTNRTSRTTNGGGAFTFTANGKVDAVSYAQKLYIDAEGNKFMTLDSSWADTQLATGNNGEGICEGFLQSLFHVNDSSPQQVFGRTSVSGVDIDNTTYSLEESSENIIKLLSFGYQTSSEGAFTNLLIFKPTSIWLLTSLTATASIEQVSANVGLVGPNAIVRTPFGVVFVGKDRAGKLNIYLLDRVSLTFHTIGHPLYEVLNSVPPANHADIIVSFDRNRMVRIALTQNRDTNINIQEYWIDFYNGIKRRTFWGPFLLGAQTMSHAIEFSGGTTPADSGFFFLEKVGVTYLIREEVDTDTYQAGLSNTDDQVLRTQLFDFGAVYGIVNKINIVARDNKAKFKVSHERPALEPILDLRGNGIDASTTITDSSPVNRTITVVGNTQIDNAVKVFGNGSILLDGTGDWMTIPDTTDLDLSSGNWTFEVLVNIDSLAVRHGLYSQAIDGDNYFWIYIDTNGFVNLLIRENGSTSVSLIMTDNALVISTWYHIRVCELQDDYYIFINGKERKTIEDTSRPQNYTSVAYIGGGWDGTTVSDPFDGHMELIRLYKDALSNTNFSPPFSEDEIDNHTNTRLISNYQMGNSGQYVAKPVRPFPKVKAKQFGIRIDSDSDTADNQPFELSQVGFDYVITQREVIE